MRTIRDSDLHESLDKVSNLLREMARKRPLRDPIAMSIEELGFTPSQIHSLLGLGIEGPMTMSELAARVGITEKTITGVVDRLEREDFVARTRSDADRRVVRVSLTEKGSATFSRFDGHLREQMLRLLGILDPEDREALVRILQKLVASDHPLCAPPEPER